VPNGLPDQSNMTPDPAPSQAGATPDQAAQDREIGKLASVICSTANYIACRDLLTTALAQATAQGRKEERERCARIAEEQMQYVDNRIRYATAQEIADAIRRQL